MDRKSRGVPDGHRGNAKTNNNNNNNNKQIILRKKF
jgi:hypothetical protein